MSNWFMFLFIITNLILVLRIGNRKLFTMLDSVQNNFWKVVRSKWHRCWKRPSYR